MKKILKCILIPIGSLVGLFLLVWLGLVIAKFAIYRDYHAQGEAISKIPGLNNGFVPQGLDYVDANTFIHSGYNGKAAELYLSVDNKGKHLIPVDENGTPLEGHGGGIASVGDYVYLANDEKVIVFRYADLLAAKDGDKVACIDVMPVDTAASFCFSDGQFLYVGEFYMAEKYEIDPSHAYTTPSGDAHHALVSCYPLNDNGSIADIYPLYSIALPERVQGFAIKDGTVILSRSWGLNSSSLDFYEGILDSGTEIDVSGKSVPLYYIDSTNYQRTVTLPAFSEGLDIMDGRVVVTFESACNKYIVGKLFFADKVIAFPVQ